MPDKLTDEIANLVVGEVAGSDDDGTHFRVVTDRLPSSSTNLALENGFVVDTVDETELEPGYSMRVEFGCTVQTATDQLIITIRLISGRETYLDRGND